MTGGGTLSLFCAGGQQRTEGLRGVREAPSECQKVRYSTDPTAKPTSIRSTTKASQRHGRYNGCVWEQPTTETFLAAGRRWLLRHTAARGASYYVGLGICRARLHRTRAHAFS